MGEVVHVPAEATPAFWAGGSKPLHSTLSLLYAEKAHTSRGGVGPSSACGADGSACRKEEGADKITTIGVVRFVRRFTAGLQPICSRPRKSGVG
jgi:hypothetical protein